MRKKYIGVFIKHIKFIECTHVVNVRRGKEYECAVISNNNLNKEFERAKMEG